MPCSGYCVLARRGGIYHRNMTTGERSSALYSLAKQANMRKTPWNIGWWLMPAIAKFTLMRQGPRAVIRAWGVQKWLNSKIHLAVDAHGMPVRVAVTAGTIADWTQAAALIDGIAAQFLLADRRYDCNGIIDKFIENGCEIIIPPKKES